MVARLRAGHRRRWRGRRVTRSPARRAPAPGRGLTLAGVRELMDTMDTKLLPAFVGTPETNKVYNCDALTLLRAMASQSVNCIVTSPPYFGLRDYGMAGQIGLEETPAAYVAKLVELFREAKRVLRDDGTFWLNLGDSYASGEIGRHDSVQANNGRDWSGTRKALIRQQTKLDTGLQQKNLIGIPWRVAFGLQDDGWILRSDIIWHKPNPMPESVTDRPTKAHEYVFLFAKSQRYWYDADAIKEPLSPESKLKYANPKAFKSLKGYHSDNSDPKGGGFRGKGGLSGFDGTNRINGGRNKRTVWSVTTEPFDGAHFATFPTKLIEPMILAGCPIGGVVYDPFMGSGTTALVARQNGREYIGSELNPSYVEITRDRLDAPYTPMFAELLTA